MTMLYLKTSIVVFGEIRNLATLLICIMPMVNAFVAKLIMAVRVRQAPRNKKYKIKHCWKVILFFFFFY